MTRSIDFVARAESWPLRSPVRIARQTYVAMDVVVVELRDANGNIGRGEAAGLPYEGERIGSMIAEIEAAAPAIAETTRSKHLLAMMRRGGARNALDCALWDLRCKQTGSRIWNLARTAQPRPLQTALTFGIDDDLDAYRAALRAARHMPVIKLKADRSHHIGLAEIARAELPRAQLLIDANGSWDRDLLDGLAPALHRLGVELIEQPVAAGEDGQLEGYSGPIALAADESCTDCNSLAKLRGLYSFVNIKLDKSGGLTEALALARLADREGFGLMVGNMGGTSLSMAAHFPVALGARYVDLDAPLLCRDDRRHALLYGGATVHPPTSALWG